jgi:hypothetical protein
MLEKVGLPKAGAQVGYGARISKKLSSSRGRQAGRMMRLNILVDEFGTVDTPIIV